jgi:hypothetical protein
MLVASEYTFVPNAGPLGRPRVRLPPSRPLSAGDPNQRKAILRALILAGIACARSRLSYLGWPELGGISAMAGYPHFFSEPSPSGFASLVHPDAARPRPDRPHEALT